MILPADLPSSAARAWAEGERGDLRSLIVGLAPAADTDADADSVPAKAWNLALAGLRFAYGIGPATPPSPADAARLVTQNGDSQIPLLRLCEVSERICVSTWDRSGLSVWTDLHQLIESQGPTPGGALSLKAAQNWQARLAGDPIDVQVLRWGFDAASAARDSRLMIDFLALMTCTALANDAVDQAVITARRAVLMAQGEGRPLDEYLASIILARARRYQGRPHLALHILGALTRVAPWPFRPWISWESQLSGGAIETSALVKPPTTKESSSQQASRALFNLIRAAVAGDVDAVARQGQALKRATAPCPDWAREATALVFALDGQRHPAPAAVQDWRQGTTPTVPLGLLGLGVVEKHSLFGDTAPVFVVARPAACGYRVLRPGLGLCENIHPLPQSDAGDDSGSRVDTALAELALAGPEGQTREDFFYRVYGFPFRADLHQGVLDVLVHRLRARIANLGDIERASEPPRITLHLKTALAIPDGRGALSMSDRVLRAVATLGAVAATDAATALQMPLRSVQRALRQLVKDGACTTKRDGLHISYSVTDTAFTAIITEWGTVPDPI